MKYVKNHDTQKFKTLQTDFFFKKKTSWFVETAMKNGTKNTARKTLVFAGYRVDLLIPFCMFLCFLCMCSFGGVGDTRPAQAPHTEQRSTTPHLSLASQTDLPCSLLRESAGKQKCVRLRLVVIRVESGCC